MALLWCLPPPHNQSVNLTLHTPPFFVHYASLHSCTKTAPYAAQATSALSEVMNPEIYELRSYVTVDCEIGFIPIEDSHQKIGYFKAFGTYKSGSAGSSDAYHIRGMMAYAQERFFQRFWVLDLSDLDYEWGDEMDLVLGLDEFEGVEVIATVFGPKCVEAVATLGGMDRKPEDLLSEEGNFLKIKDAYEYLLPKIT